MILQAIFMVVVFAAMLVFLFFQSRCSRSLRVAYLRRDVRWQFKKQKCWLTDWLYGKRCLACNQSALYTGLIIRLDRFPEEIITGKSSTDNFRPVVHELMLKCEHCGLIYQRS